MGVKRKVYVCVEGERGLQFSITSVHISISAHAELSSSNKGVVRRRFTQCPHFYYLKILSTLLNVA